MKVVYKFHQPIGRQGSVGNRDNTHAGLPLLAQDICQRAVGGERCLLDFHLQPEPLFLEICGEPEHCQLARDYVAQPNLSDATSDIERTIGEAFSQQTRPKQLFGIYRKTLLSQKTRKTPLSLHEACAVRSRPTE